MNAMIDDAQDLNKELSAMQKLHSETALIRWHDLQRFFAQGVVIVVGESLNLVETAALFAEDQVDDISALLNAEFIAYPENDQARAWYKDNVELWSVVVAPYVLVQTQKLNAVD